MSDEQKLMPLKAIDALNPTYTHNWLAQTARAAHALKAECSRLIEEHENLNTNLQAYRELAEERKRSLEKICAEAEQENEKLRAVYEAARRVLRFNGVDNQRVIEAIQQMDDACETMKLLDSGNANEI